MRQSLRNRKGQALTEYVILLVMLLTTLIGVNIALKGNVIAFWEDLINKTIGPSPLKKPTTPKRIGS